MILENGRMAAGDNLHMVGVTRLITRAAAPAGEPAGNLLCA